MPIFSLFLVDNDEFAVHRFGLAVVPSNISILHRILSYSKNICSKRYIQFIVYLLEYLTESVYVRTYAI